MLNLDLNIPMALPSPHFRPAEPGGFSLVELLVVIAIIAVLGALLAPGAGKMRDRSREAKCAATMRALGQAVAVYQADHDGYLPANKSSSGGTAEQTWTVMLRPYLGIEDLKTYGSGTDRMAALLTCHSSEATNKPSKWWESNYAAGLCFGTDGTPRRTVTRNASATLMFIEGVTPSTRSLNITPLPWTSVGYRHGGRANAVFLDGHGESRTVADVPQTLGDVFWGAN